MRRATFQLWLVLLTVALLAGGCVTGPTISRLPPAIQATERPAHNLRVFDRASELVRTRFYDEKLLGADWAATVANYRPKAEKAADDEELYYGVLNPMLAELKSSHLLVVAPKQAYERGVTQSALLGLRFQRIENRWVVREVMPGSAAESAGVRPGWIVVKLNGKSLDEKRLPLKDGQSVPVEFIDGKDEIRTLLLTAGMVSTAPRLVARELPGGMWYLRFDEFNRASRRWLSEQLKAHASAPAVIVDLRNNPGGEAFSLIISIGEFFAGEVAVGTFIKRNGRARDMESLTWKSARYAGRIALLVDGSSASCSEIFAHVLKHHHRAILVGQKTAGAVIASVFYALPGDGRLQIATWDYRGVDGQRLEGVGVTPDVVVPVKLADLRAGRDAELEAAISELGRTNEPAVP